ncbi:MAG: ArsI/CadI family heavy metal resistance metalloenzyme, partial [Marmoricola sp.]
MSRVQLALNVDDLEVAVAFYSALFNTEPAKTKSGYANFAVSEPPLKLVLIENPGHGGSLNHLGVEVDDVNTVDAIQTRLAEEGLASVDERSTTCCYAKQDKFWVENTPGGEKWEVYTVKADAPDAAGIHPVGVTPDATGDCRCGSPVSDEAPAGAEQAAC